MTDQSVVDKTMRSVFVGNIPYEVSEEKLKDIFSVVGPVLSFKLVFDRDSGKPKGYGFCEYKDQETALSAMRNLNNYEIAGRNLRVDNACTEKSRLEMQSLMQSGIVESIYGEPVPPEKTKEVISRAIASLPPEQMYDLIKQMRQYATLYPEETSTMLMKNPQLAYALLQVLISMKLTDVQTAVSLLHRSNEVPPILGETPQVSSDSLPSSNGNKEPTNNSVPPASTPEYSSMNEQRSWNNMNGVRQPPSNVSQQHQPLPNVSQHQPPPPPPPPLNTHTQQSSMATKDMDMRAVDINMQSNRFADQDLRIPPMSSFPQNDMLFTRDPRVHQSSEQFSGMYPPHNMMRPPPPNMQMGMAMQMPAMSMMPPQSAPRMVPPPMTQTNRMPQGMPGLSNPAPMPGMTSNVPPSGTNNEKAALIMHVLQLTDEQIAKLPNDQRQSILALKDQIAKSAKR